MYDIGLTEVNICEKLYLKGVPGRAQNTTWNSSALDKCKSTSIDHFLPFNNSPPFLTFHTVLLQLR